MDQPVLERDADDIRAYLRGRVNSAIRRLGVFGGEVSLVLLGEALAYACGQEQQWERQRAELKDRDAFYPTGVTGAAQDVLRRDDRPDDAVASVYAELAHRNGWLNLDRTLTVAKYDRLSEQIAAMCKRDWTLTELTLRLGAPSVLCGGGNPRYPSSLVYLAEDPERPAVCLHFWNGADERTGQWPKFSEPILFAVRHGPGRFRESFTFTPAGSAHVQR
ncbi:hypothetical protein ACFP2T_04700 [Plantactinospora solaniradicis]|uniref:Uncharacterized protein n=1 Tax=Plantactinospora solaniradicis TaxID=1723736 RepID=A0ABW1K174_9ACTN